MNDNSIYPLKFSPLLKPKVWGGTKLTQLNKDFSLLPNCGETWELSGVETDQSVVLNGFLAGNEINELVEIYMGELVGDHVFETFGNQFPLLFKFIDATDYLSVQVHPNDSLAAERHDSHGKTEMWYIIDADKGAKLISGFSHHTTKEDYLEAMSEGSIKELLRYEDAKKGDVFFIPSGRIHAIGPGILLAEIQQTSDITYRIYDWDRADTTGALRELHTELAVDAIDFSTSNSNKIEGKTELNKTLELVRCPYFVTNKISFDTKVEKIYAAIDSFVVYMCVEGSYTISYGDESLMVAKGETVLIPAIFTEIDLIPHEPTTLLEVYIP